MRTTFTGLLTMRLKLTRRHSGGSVSLAVKNRDELVHGDLCLCGVMGIQDKGEVALIRNAYVRTTQRQGGIGTKLLMNITQLTDKTILIGTWEAATWAISLYFKNGLGLVNADEKGTCFKNIGMYWGGRSRSQSFCAR
ncbi:GNAT family N-acetyltransferase [Paenibacillus sepulcri]|uniref:N-acetyltransferase domain-containing protein n=1 Tax=Paenibacillus sepulcri TaxID=359917 RepID=A0ABS7C1I7_9BACL|nr:hypothetical protein [Paenibacillus sepulcri]